MQKAILIDPVTRTSIPLQIVPNDFRTIRVTIGGYPFEEHVVRSGERVIGRVFMAENRDALPSQESFSFENLTVARKSDHRIYGAALFVPKDNSEPDAEVRFFSDADALPHSKPVVRTMSNAEIKRYVESGEAEKNNATFLTARDSDRTWAKTTGHNPDQGFAEHFDREPRHFIPRAVGTFESRRCSVYELEAAFLGFHEWVRKDHTFRRDSSISRSFNASPFFFPDGLEPSDEEFNAGLALEEGSAQLPFPQSAFWVVHWDVWLSGVRGFEGPVLLYVEEHNVGFTTRNIFCGGPDRYSVSDLRHHESLGRVPTALVTALHRINNRRQIIEHDVACPGRDRINAGRAKSKFGLAPLPGFIRVTGNVRVDHPSVNGTGVERCPHDRRGHWRKRRNGVELPPDQWIRVRACAIHPEKGVAAPKPYVVI